MLCLIYKPIFFHKGRRTYTYLLLIPSHLTNHSGTFFGHLFRASLSALFLYRKIGIIPAISLLQGKNSSHGPLCTSYNHLTISVSKPSVQLLPLIWRRSQTGWQVLLVISYNTMLLFYFLQKVLENAVLLFIVLFFWW